MRKKDIGCKWKDVCDCESIKSTTCENCGFYSFIDSGFGVCKALPVFEVVAWCGDICGLFSRG